MDSPSQLVLQKQLWKVWDLFPLITLFANIMPVNDYFGAVYFWTHTGYPTPKSQ